MTSSMPRPEDLPSPPGVNPLGHWWPAHEAFGWCSKCPGVNGNAEAAAWRLRYSGSEPWPYEYAREVVACSR